MNRLKKMSLLPSHLQLRAFYAFFSVCWNTLIEKLYNDTLTPRLGSSGSM